MSSWVKCWVDNGPRSVVVLSITRRLSGETSGRGHQGSHVQATSVRSEYASFPSRTTGGVLRVSTATAFAPSR